MEREFFVHMCARCVDMVMWGVMAFNLKADKKPKIVLLGTYFIIFIYLMKKPLYAGYGSMHVNDVH